MNNIFASAKQKLLVDEVGIACMWFCAQRVMISSVDCSPCDAQMNSTNDELVAT